MSTNKKLAEMMRRKNALEAKVKALKEAKAQQSSTGLAYLIESELEKAEVLLAAKSVVEKLQKMAEDLAKVNGDEIMPIMEPLKSAFGPQMADAFQAMVSEKINATTVAVSQAKDAISAEVAKFEGIINGTSPGNDMAAAAPVDPTAAAPGAPAPMGADAGLDMGAGAPADPMDADGSKADPLADDGMDGLDSAFEPEDASAAGRAKKESARPKGKMVESTDSKILNAFRTKLRESGNPVLSAKHVAASFKVEFADVVEIVRESGLGK